MQYRFAAYFGKLITRADMPWNIKNKIDSLSTERFIYYRKTVLHMLKHMLQVSRCSTDLQHILEHLVCLLQKTRKYRTVENRLAAILVLSFKATNLLKGLKNRKNNRN